MAVDAWYEAVDRMGVGNEAVYRRRGSDERALRVLRSRMAETSHSCAPVHRRA